MIVTILDLKKKYMEYADINCKIKRDVKNNILFPVVRGIWIGYNKLKKMIKLIGISRQKSFTSQLRNDHKYITANNKQFIIA